MAFVLKLGARFFFLPNLEIHIATTNKAEKDSQNCCIEYKGTWREPFSPPILFDRPQTLPAAAATSSEPPQRERNLLFFAHERWNRNSWAFRRKKSIICYVYARYWRMFTRIEQKSHTVWEAKMFHPFYEVFTFHHSTIDFSCFFLIQS